MNEESVALKPWEVYNPPSFLPLLSSTANAKQLGRELNNFPILDNYFELHSNSTVLYSDFSVASKIRDNLLLGDTESFSST